MTVTTLSVPTPVFQSLVSIACAGLVVYRAMDVQRLVRRRVSRMRITRGVGRISQRGDLALQATIAAATRQGRLNEVDRDSEYPVPSFVLC